jgi:hypothetical protein
MRESVIAIAVRFVATLLLLVTLPSAVYAAGPTVSIIGGGQVFDSGPGPKVAQFTVDAYFTIFKPITCQPSNPNCNDRTVHICVDYHTASGTGPNAATPDGDFFSKQGSFDKTVTFTEESDDIPIGTIDVEIVPDDLTEGPETFKVILSNPANCHSDAALGDTQAEATIVDGTNPPPLPDLNVSAIRLLKGCKMALTIQNAGPGPISDQAYDPTHGAVIQMRRNGEPWGGIRLAGADPAKKLKVPGASIQYTWFPNAANLNLAAGLHDVSVVIDRLNAVPESNEQNNTTRARLVCKR